MIELTIEDAFFPPIGDKSITCWILSNFCLIATVFFFFSHCRDQKLCSKGSFTTHITMLTTPGSWVKSNCCFVTQFSPLYSTVMIRNSISKLVSLLVTLYYRSLISSYKQLWFRGGSFILYSAVETSVKNAKFKNIAWEIFCLYREME